MKAKKRAYKKVCELCGKKKQSARTCIHPYIDALQDKQVKCVLCKECFHELNMSI